MVVSFHGSHDIGRDVDDATGALRGEISVGMEAIRSSTKPGSTLVYSQANVASSR